MIKTQVTLWAVGENSFYKVIRFLTIIDVFVSCGRGRVIIILNKRLTVQLF